MNMLFLVATTAVAVAQSPDNPSRPVAPPSGGGFEAALISDTSVAGGKKRPMIPSIDVGGVNLKELMGLVEEALEKQGAPVPNVVYKDDVEDEMISSLLMRNVSFQGLLHALEAIVGLDVEFVENPGGEEIIVLKRGRVRVFRYGQTPQHGQENVVPSRRVVFPEHVPGPSHPQLELDSGGRSGFRSAPDFGGEGHPANEHATKVFATSDLGVKEEELMSTIRAVWDISDPDWAEGKRAAKLLYHSGTRMLVVKASPARLSDVDQVIQQLSQVKERAEKNRLNVVMLQMKELQKSGERELVEMEKSRARAHAEMAESRSELMDKVRDLEAELRESERQRAKIQMMERARQEGGN